MRALAAAIALTLLSAQAWGQGNYNDGATSQWFKSLTSAYTQNCCDQADCARAMSDYRDGAWWALSNRTKTWVRISPSQVTSTVSIFKDAILCEGDPVLTAVSGTELPRIFCFAPPPLGF